MNEKVASQLKTGKVGVIPTDTVYGLVCSALSHEAVARLYTLKSRENKPGTLVAASVAQLVDLGIPKRYLTAVEHYWPNSLSIVLPTGRGLAYLDQGRGSLAVRVPKHPAFVALLEQTGPLMTSSANLPGKPPAKTINDARSYFEDSIDFYLDGGEVDNSKSSTIIRIVDDSIEVLRQGVVHVSDSGEIL